MSNASDHRRGRNKHGGSAVCALAAILITSSASAMDGTQDTIISKCTQTINQYAHYRDQLDADGWADLFTTDGVFIFPGMTLTGREALAERLRKDDGSKMSRHLTGSIAVSIDNKDKITALSYVYVFQADTPELPGVVPASKYSVAEYHDEMRMMPSGCKFAKREAKLVFTSGGVMLL